MIFNTTGIENPLKYIKDGTNKSILLGDMANNVASGQYSVAEGYWTTASGGGSHAEGVQTIASVESAHAEGSNTTASGLYSHTEGQYTQASDSTAHAEGYYTTAASTAAHAEGNATTASGLHSHTEGYQTLASTVQAHAEGRETTASGQNSHAEGWYSIASGNYSHAEGFGTNATKSSAHTEGTGTTASGSGSHAEGWYSIASGNYSHAGGQGTIAGDIAQTSIGKYNATTTGTAFVIGGGTADNARKDIFSVDWDGNVEANGTIKADVWKTARNLTVGNQTVLVNGSGDYSWPNPLKIGYYGSDNANSNGWYKVMTISQTGYSDCNLNLLITSGFYIRATGLLYVHVRCNNGTVFDIQSVKWMYRYGFHTDDVYVKDNGNNTWSLYVYQRHDQYGRIQVQILTETNTSASQWNINLTSNTTKESAAPTGGVASSDGASLSLEGGTITGSINLKDSPTDASKTNNNISSTRWPTTLNVTDTVGRILGRVETIVNPNGSIGLHGYVRNYNTSGTQVAQKGIGMYMDKSGNLTYSVGDPANFRSAIGVTTPPSVNSEITVGTDNQTIASGSWKNIGSFSVPAGTYLITCGLLWGAHTTGIRTSAISTSSSTPDSYISCTSSNGMASVNIRQHITRIVSNSTTKTYYLIGYQNSGSALAIVARAQLTRLG